MNKQTSQANHKSMKCLKLVGQYVINMEQKLGEGSYGTVYAATLQTDQSKQYAVKVIPSQIFKTSLHNSEMLKKEIEVLKKLRHENIVCLHEISQSSNNLYLFLDYCNGGDLAEYISSKPSKRLSESESIEFFKQFVDAYQYLYSQKIIHRDIKPENLMLHNGKIKLADFGFGRFIEGEMDHQQRMSIKCTPIYASPQLLKRSDYSSKCDIWSAACVFYKMLYGKYPFTAANQQQLLENIERKVQKQPFIFPLEPPISEGVKQLITRMLKFEEQDRISWEELFKHPIIIQNKKMNILDIEETNEKEGNPLYQSIIENRQKVEANDVITDYAQNENILKKNNSQEQNKENSQNNNIQQITITTIEENENKFQDSFQKFQQQDNQMHKIIKVDKMILFLRNQALFADVVMQLVFTSRNKFKIPSLLFYDIIYCLTGFYHFNLDLLKKILFQQIQIRFVQPSEFQLYLSSQHYIKTKQKIEQDSSIAAQFFQTLLQGIYKEVVIFLQNPQSQQGYEQAKDLENFLKKQSANYNEYKQRFIDKYQQITKLIQLESISQDINSLRGVRGLQIFSKLDIYMPLQQYLSYDFRLFYDNQMNNLTNEQLLKLIKEEKL